MDRLVSSGDPEGLRALAAARPEAAAMRLAVVLSAAPAGQPCPLDDVAEELCDRLRRTGKLVAAHKLALAGAHRSAALRIERGLSAFAMGDDADAARAAAGDPEVARVMQPLLEASGAVPAPASKGRRAGGLSPGLAALHGVARAVTAASQGRSGPAAAALRRVDEAHRAGLLAAEISAALRLGTASTDAALRDSALALAASARIQEDKAAALAVVRAVARRSARAALVAAGPLGVPQEAIRSVSLRAALERPTSGEVGAPSIMEAARALGPAAFAPEDAAAASVFEGFSWLNEDHQRANAAFDRAIALGGDLFEALRGKMLAATTERCSGCGQTHGAHGREAAIAADHLARALSRSPLGAPFSAAASILAAEAWVRVGDRGAAARSIQAARTAMPEGLEDELDLREALLHLTSAPDRAAELLEKIVKRNPAHARAWILRVDLAMSRGDKDLALRLAASGAEATRDPMLVQKARELRVERGDLAPYEGLVPGATTAGALALDLMHAALAKGELAAALPPVARACRDALPPAARLAFDAAAVTLLRIDASAKAGESLLEEALSAWWAEPERLATLAPIVWPLGLEKKLVELARRMHDRPDAGAALLALAGAAVAAEDADTAERLLSLSASRWSREDTALMKSAIAELKKADEALFEIEDPGKLALLRSSIRRRGAKTPESAAAEIDAHLAPELSLSRILFEDPFGDEDPFDDSPEPSPEPSMEDIARQLAGVLRRRSRPDRRRGGRKKKKRSR